jgi:thiol-disulfide isomerase/thioredoxin
MQPVQRRGLYILLLLAALVWIVASTDHTGSSTTSRFPAPQKGFLAPDFSLASPKGNKYTLSELRGEAVVMNLWATWCPPCRAEMPVLEECYGRYQRGGLVVLGVNATSQDYPVTFPILLDETGEMARNYEMQSLPSTFS